MEETKQSSMFMVKLAISWAIVGLPLLWGVSQTLEKAMLLFQQ